MALLSERHHQMGRTLRNLIGLLILPATLILSLILLNGEDPTRPVESLRDITSSDPPTSSAPTDAPTSDSAPSPATKSPATVPPIIPSPGEVKKPGDGNLSSEEIIAVAQKVCPEVLGSAKECKKYPVSVQKLNGEAGRAVSEARWNTRNDVYSSEIVPVKIILDAWMKEQNPEYVRHVAAHEWNHVKQYLVAKTPERYAEMQDAANDYFAPRAKVSLEGTTGGMELLTDCMTVQGDGIGMGKDRKGVTAYVRGMTDAKTMEEVCGDDWESLIQQK